MKQFNVMMMLALMSFVVVSCNNDDEPADTVSPTVSLVTPEANDSFAPGDSISVTGTVTDDRQLSSINISVTPEGGTNPVVTETITSFDSPTSHALNVDILIPADAEIGLYRINVIAVDATGNQSTPADVLVEVKWTCVTVASCNVDGQATIILSVPETTPGGSDIYVVGSFNGWDPGDVNFKLTKNPVVPNCYCISVALVQGDEFKFTRGSWETVEKALECAEADNRIYDNEDKLEITIIDWRDLCEQ